MNILQKIAVLLVLSASLAFAQAKPVMNVLFPPSPNSADVKLLMTNPLVTGTDIVINWSDVDEGGGIYNFNIPDEAAAPWIAAKKIVNFVVWANSDSASGKYGNASVPLYVWTALGPSNYVTCQAQAGDQRIPNYLNAIWIKDYEAFITQVLKHYNGKTGIGYIRFGLGHGGETIPVADWNSKDTCGQAFSKWGVNISSWEEYLKTLLIYESQQPGASQRMVGITPMGNPGDQVPDYIASIASPLKIGFGSQGLESSDLKGCKTTTADWCELFAKYLSVPHELQTIGPSCPTGNNCPGNQGLTGPLPTLLVYAKANKNNIFEIYYADWCIAYCKDSPHYTQYHTAYANALEATAQ